MKPRHRLRNVLIVLLLLALVVYVGGRHLLASRYVADKVASRLVQASGAPVTLGTVDLGMGGTVVRGLRLYEQEKEGTAPTAEPWLVVGEVHADVTLWQAIWGTTALHELTVKDAVINLHFDKAGHLLTRLPKGEGEPAAVPAVHVTHSGLIIRQDDRPPMTIKNVSGDLQTEDGTLVLTGGIDDPTWGDWTLRADWKQSDSQGSATLSCPRLHLTQQKVEVVPLVPASIWQEVNGLEGDTRVEFALSSASPSGPVHYQLTLEPLGTTVHVPSIDLAGELTAGAVVVKDGLVELRKVASKVAGGEVALNGELDFRNEKRTRMHFDVDAKRLAMAKLPVAKWDLPQKITGHHLSGKADLLLTIVDGQVHTSGEGKAVVSDAKVAGQPARLEFRLVPAGKGFRFTNPDVSALQRPEVLAQLLTLMVANPEPEPEPLDWVVNLPARMTDELARGLHLVTRSILVGSQKLQSVWPKRRLVPPGPDESFYLEVKLGMDDVDLAALIKNLDVHLPFAVTGKLSFELLVAIPTDTPKDMKAYRLNGSASLAWLTLEDLRLEQVRARVSYADGVLRLEELTGQLPDRPGPPATPGSFAGTARLELFPAKDLHASLTLRRLPLSRLASLVPGLADNVAGVFTGTLSLRAPAEHLRDLTIWEANCSLDSEWLQLFAKLEKIAAQLDLREGHLGVSRLRATLEGGPLTGSGKMTLAGAYPYEGKLDFRDVNLAMLERLAQTGGSRPPLASLPIAVGGRLTLGVTVSGTLDPITVRARGKADAKDLTLQKVTVSSLRFDWDSDGKQLTLSDLQATLYRGQLTGRASIPLRAQEKGSIDVGIETLDLRRLAASLPPLPVRVEGRADGTLKATLPPAQASGQREWMADVTVRSSHLKVQGIPAQEVGGSVRYRNAMVEYRFQGETLGGTFHVEGKLPPPTLQRSGQGGSLPATPAPPQEPPGELQGSVRFDNLSLTRIWPLLGLESSLVPLRGSVGIELKYRVGSDGQPTGRGTLAIRDLRWRGTRFVESTLRGRLVLAGPRLRVGLATSGLGGYLNVQVGLNLRDQRRSWFDLAAESVDLSRMLAPWPELLSQFRGHWTAQLHGSLGDEWQGSGRIALEGATLYGVQISQWQLPIDVSFSPRTRLGQIVSHDSTLQFFTGRATGKANLTWGAATRMDGQLNFSGVELRHLLEHGSELSHFGSGRLSGQLTFGGDNVRSLEDVTANLNATLQDAQALQFPVLEGLPHLFGHLSSVTVFSNGAVRARLAREIVHVERLTLQSSALRVFLTGTVTVPQGRLNLDATLGPGGLLLPCHLQGQVKSAVQSTNPVPGGLLEAIAQAAGLLLSVHVSGTLNHPAYQIQPLRRLTEETLRFLAL